MGPLNLTKTKALLIDSTSSFEEILSHFRFEYLDCVPRDIDARILIENQNKYDIVFYNSEFIKKPVEFLNFLRKNRDQGSIDFILISSPATKGDLIEAAINGIDDFIIRPITLERISERLSLLFEKKAQQNCNLIRDFCLGARYTDFSSGLDKKRAITNFSIISDKIELVSRYFYDLGLTNSYELSVLQKGLLKNKTAYLDNSETILQHLIKVFSNKLDAPDEIKDLQAQTIRLIGEISGGISAEAEEESTSDKKSNKEKELLAKLRIGKENDRLTIF